MSLADRLEEGPPLKRRPCRVVRIAAALAEDERAAFLGMLADPAWSASKIFDALKDEGAAYMPESDQFIGEHRRRKCCCP